jgi:hypothetical protein
VLVCGDHGRSEETAVAESVPPVDEDAWFGEWGAHRFEPME